MRSSGAVAHAAKTQMNGRYPQSIVDAAHEYAIAHGLSLNALLSMALAEYLAKRRESGAAAAPQLHYRKGHPPAELVRLQQELMQRDPRGRKLTDRCSRVTSAGDEATRAHGVTMRAMHHDVDGNECRHSTRARTPRVDSNAAAR